MAVGNDLRLAKVRFRAGSGPGAAPLELDCPNVTVLVGANNSGKSQALREIEWWCTSESVPQSIVVENVEVSLPTTNEITQMLGVFRTSAPPGHPTAAEHYWIFKPRVRDNEQEMRAQVPNKGFEQWQPPAAHMPLIRQYFLRFFTIRLDGRTRFDLVNPRPTGNLEDPPQNHLWKLFKDGEARERVRKFTQEAFAKHFVVDPTGLTTFRIRLSNRKPTSVAEEQALDPAAQSFHANAPLIQELGDGVQTSVGLVASIMSLPDRILLIDEPEAFLHPTLSRRVGRVLTETTRERNASMVVATHSSEFLLGCMQADPTLRIVRLGYENGQSSARSIDPSLVKQLLNDPLLRSAHSLRALFHRAALVCEADADRAFYEEVNSRLSIDSRGIEDALFMNAQNWQTIPRIVGPLRRFGCPTVAIFDFDVLMDKDFARIWPILSASDTDLRRLQSEREKTAQAMGKAGRAKCKKLGLMALPSASRESASELLSSFARYGILFVPAGELERWLPDLVKGGGKRGKSTWLEQVFESMGSDSAVPSYVRATKGDVWSFLELARDWINDPGRLGLSQ